MIVGGARLITTPKSAAGRRTVYLPPHVVVDVRHHLATYTASGANALEFPETEGQPLTAGQV